MYTKLQVIGSNVVFVADPHVQRFSMGFKSKLWAGETKLSRFFKIKLPVEYAYHFLWVAMLKFRGKMVKWFY